MKRILLIALLAISSIASENYATMKNCETLKLSRFTTLVSCHNIDYLIEHKVQDDEEKDNIKQITAITVKDKKIIISTGK